MDEMLGNQYFMARNYLEATKVFQAVLKEEPNNLNAKKKLIISFTQIGKYSKSLELFLDVIKKDVNFIVDTDLEKDDCPCAELVSSLEKQTKYGGQSFTTFQTFGILWLYCDIHKSIENFEAALKIKKKKKKTILIINILKNKLVKITN